MSQYYIRRDSNIYGPLNSKGLRNAAANGRVLPEDEISNSKSGPWHKARSVSNLFSDQVKEQHQHTTPDIEPERLSFEELVTAHQAETGVEEYDHENAAGFVSDEPNTHAHDFDFESSNRSIGQDIVDEFVPRTGMPREVRELIPEGEKIYFADHPAKIVLYIRIAFTCFFWFMCFLPLLLGFDMSLTSLVTRLIIPVGVLLLWLYVIYGSWVTTYYVITNKMVIFRGGWFNRKIKFVPIHNVQEVSINTGIIDRWLDLNTVLFSTAASSALFIFGTTGISFRSVNSRQVVTALQRAG